MTGATISGTVKIGTTTYGYAEFKSSNRGGGSRGLGIWIQGERGKTTYRKLDPNPHDSRQYNKNQSGFYQQLATEVATYHSRNRGFPAEGTTIRLLEFGGSYQLNDCW